MKIVLEIIILIFKVLTLGIDMILGIILRDFTVHMGDNITLTEESLVFPMVL